MVLMLLRHLRHLRHLIIAHDTVVRLHWTLGRFLLIILICEDINKVRLNVSGVRLKAGVSLGVGAKLTVIMIEINTFR